MPEDPVAATSASYDLIVDEYVRRTGAPPPELLAFRDAFVAAAAGGVVADAGCGPGRDARWLADAGLRVVAVDRSEGMLRRARTEGVPVVRGDLRALPFRAGALDGVWSAAALLHVPRDEVPATLRGWRRCLRAGGVLALSTALGAGEGWEDVPYAPVRRWFVYHGRDALLDLVERAGFTVTQTGERVSHRQWLRVLARAA